VEIDAGVPIRSLDSRLHEVDVERPAENRARVTLRRSREIPNRDFVLRYAVAGEEVASGYLVHRDGGDGYVTFVLLPPKRVTANNVAPKELVFVIDRSGSQSGLPLTKAKETMLWILEHLNPNDTFQVVSFSSSTELLFDRPREVTPETKRQARAYINALRANGGTMMAEAVQRVAQEPADGNRLRIVTFMTDGYIGNDFEVIDLVRRLRGTSRWFPFGTGNSVNRFLLENMGRYGGGEVEYVLLNEPGERVAKKFYERIASPVLTDVSLEFEGLDVIDVYPNAVADVWAERPLIVHARYLKPGRGSVIVHGYRQGQPYRQELEVKLPRRESSSAAIASMWARAKVEDLMAQDLRALQSGNYPAALKEEIVRVALSHRILSPFTSFVAVEDRVVNEGSEVRSVTVPVEMPQGVTYEGVFGTAGEVAATPQASFKAGRALRLLNKAPGGWFGTSSADVAVPAEPVRREQTEEMKVLSTEARKRLAPDLLALVEGRPSPAAARQVIDGKIKVKVVLGKRSEPTLRKLREAGLRVSTRTDDYVIGEIEVTRLPELAELDSVVNIALP
jgi:Ca-activated chloride channel family protein